MKVKTIERIYFNEKIYEVGAELEVTKEQYESMKMYLEVIEEKKAKKEEK